MFEKSKLLLALATRSRGYTRLYLPSLWKRQGRTQLSFALLVDAPPLETYVKFILINAIASSAKYVI
ncbi:hypothetical protein [Nostoc sp.]|uniref:hypothetical protein n=1 Tax=Nostoc sp. TaxID=1180 RepID=UPI002FFADAD3